MGPVLRKAKGRNLLAVAFADPWPEIPYAAVAKRRAAVEHLVFSSLCRGHRQTGRGARP